MVCTRAPLPAVATGVIGPGSHVTPRADAALTSPTCLATALFRRVPAPAPTLALVPVLATRLRVALFITFSIPPPAPATARFRRSGGVNGGIFYLGLDGTVTEPQTRRFATPCTDAALLDGLEKTCQELLGGSTGRVHGIGVSVPGLVNERLQEIVFCPNLHLLDKQNPARDLEQRLGMPCLLLQETDALCLSERMYGDARGGNDFAMLDVTTGLGLGVMSGGQLLAGHSGMAGEVGHITVDPDGIRCGCGNRGCLETLATDAALIRMVSEKVGRPLACDDVASLLNERAGDFQHEVRTVTEYTAIAIAAVINIFNPTTLFVHGTLLVGSAERFARVVERVKQRTLTASLADCRIVAARSSKRQAAVAGIMDHLTNAWAPSIR